MGEHFVGGWMKWAGCAVIIVAAGGIAALRGGGGGVEARPGAAGVREGGAGTQPAVSAAFGRVPVSVAVRKQSPEVEKIIAALEEKAKGAVGVWKTMSGPEGGRLEPWDLVASADGEWV